jgi:hypothetical protein
VTGPDAEPPAEDESDLPAAEEDLPAAEEDLPAQVGLLAAALDGLGDLAALPVAEHVERYDALHGELQDALASIDGV